MTNHTRLSRTFLLMAFVLIAFVGGPVGAEALPGNEAEVSLEPAMLEPSAVVVDRLVTLGLTEGEARQKLSGLTSDEIASLAADPEQLGMGGVSDKTIITVALILIAPSIIILLLI